jgi:8-oxo-dGTP diphosphatase
VSSVIHAAGVVLLRGTGGDAEVLIVHRPGLDDWSLPKGKVDPGEHVIEAAVREVDEETGFVPVLGCPLPSMSYSVQSQPKVVRYWTARVGVEEGFAPDDEIDALEWVPVDQAAARLTYPRDADLVSAAAALPPTSPLVILRHAQAIKRADFDGADDDDRPLSGVGRSQAKRIARLLDAFGVSAVHTSSARRCEQTVRRFARGHDLEVMSEGVLTEQRHADKPGAARRRMRDLARMGEPIVVCGHRPVLPTMLEAVAEELDIDTEAPDIRRAWDPRLPPGGFIVLHRAVGPDGAVRAVAAERHTLSGD